ncbi:MAG: D-2-hydroxyacid dehydrogenase [Verrucomicrobiota bacterium]
MKSPKIVVLDGYTTNPGDVSWAELQALGDVEIFDRTSPAEVLERAQFADVILSNKVPLDAATIQALPNLKGICVLATGYNLIDGVAARARNIPVCNVPEYSTTNVAQAVFSLILELANRSGYHAQTVREGRWAASKDFCYWDYPLVELEGLTLGIVGYGRIGERVAAIAHGFGMKVIAYRRNFSGTKLPVYVEAVDLDSAFSQSDIVSLHCPLTPETRGLVNAARIATMKASAFLVNTARGPLVDEADLAAALNSSRIAGAGLDVLSMEPPSADNPLFGARNCVITPHIAWATRNARIRLLAQTVENVRGCLAGKPVNVVN